MPNNVPIWEIITLVFMLNLVLAVVLVLFERHNPIVTLVWLMVIFFIPIIGFILYLFLGQDLRKRKLFKLKGKEEDSIIRATRYQYAMIYGNQYKFKDPLVQKYADVIRLNLMSSEASFTQDNKVKILPTGKEKFQNLLDNIRKAQQYIYLEYYIIRNDDLGIKIRDLLTAKAREGIIVKVLYDGMGCRKLSKKFFQPLINAGGKIAEFYPPFIPYINLRVNYRNHRKICIIDGNTGYIGGFNIGNEYLGLSKKFGFWRDIHLRINGSAVKDLEFRFILDWRFASGEETPFSFKKVHFSKHLSDGDSGDTAIQIVSGGPDSKWHTIRNSYLKIINNARHHVYLETPYFIPDNDLLSALKIAALSGVDVRLIIPLKEDHPFVHWASLSYIGELLEAGIKAYTYHRGFIHSKMITADGFISSVGTANLDIRSLYTNFEINAFIYSSEVAEELDRLFLQDIEDSTEITLEIYNKRSIVVKIKESVCRLLSPLL
ncbi:MAG: cardiolipin synthase [Bacillota bacterium]|jgi:cardiolipin synthase